MEAIINLLGVKNYSPYKKKLLYEFIKGYLPESYIVIGITLVIFIYTDSIGLKTLSISLLIPSIFALAVKISWIENEIRNHGKGKIRTLNLYDFYRG